MKKYDNAFIVTACMVILLALTLFFMAHTAFAVPTGEVPSEADRIAMEARVRTDVQRDLVRPYKPKEGLQGRTAIDGRSLEDFQGNIIEYWVNLECTYCGVKEPVKAQRNDENMRLVVRHVPASNYSESLKKALSYEALKAFSANAANLFWDEILPKTSLAIPVPYEASLMFAFQEAQIPPEVFADTLTGKATDIVKADTQAAQGRIFSSPTYVIEGIRFPACNFTAKELTIALDLAQKARAGDNDALERIIKIIVNGLSNVPIFDASI